MLATSRLTARTTALSGPIGPGDRRFLSDADCTAVFDRLKGWERNGMEVVPELVSWWTGTLRWGRNQLTLASDRRDIHLGVQPRARIGHWNLDAAADGGAGRAVETNQLDDVSLQNVLRQALINGAQDHQIPGKYDLDRPPLVPPKPMTSLWNDATYAVTAEGRAAVARKLVAAAEAKGLLSAGYLELRAGSRAWFRDGQRYYAPFTYAQ